MLSESPDPKPSQTPTPVAAAVAPESPKRWRHRLFGRPRLSTLLLAVNLILLIAPLSGIFALRLYESALIRQTETGLISQSAFVSASFRAALERNKAPRLEYSELSHPVSKEFLVEIDPDRPWQPRPPQLDLARDPLLPPPGPPQETEI